MAIVVELPFPLSPRCRAVRFRPIFLMKLLPRLALSVSSAVSISAAAASLPVQVVDTNGAPVADAIVYAVPLHGAVPPAKPGEIVIDQVKRHFVPMVSVARTGTTVRFPNKDNFEHDVYSFSPAKNFHLNLYHGETAKPVQFDKAGLVVMGCSIHDQMVAYLMLVDTPYFAKTDQTGVAHLDNLPADTYKVTAWHYKMIDLDKRISTDMAAGSAQASKLTLALKPD